jgi:alcohol dehydrogenase
MLSDIFPTGLECGVLPSKIAPGSTVAIVGAGPVGLAALIAARFYSPSLIIMICTNANRLKVAKELGADLCVVNPRGGGNGGVKETVMEATGGRGVDAVLEAVGVKEAFELCEEIVAPGGVIANVGVHGKKVDLHLEDLWARNICKFLFVG